MMTMNSEEQKIDLRVSNIAVSIAPAALKTAIAVANSLGTVKVKEEKMKKDVLMENLD